MSTPSVPLLRPPVPGNRSNTGSPRAPRLTLGIPPSPNAKPVNGTGPAPIAAAGNDAPKLQLPQPVSRPALPRLQLATPMGSSQSVPQESSLKPNGRPAPPPLATNLNGQNGLESKGSGPTSANSSYSALSFAMGLRQPAGGNSDPSSAISSVYSDRDGGVQMERENSVNGLLPDLDKLSLEKGRPLDVEDLDDEGWHAASEQKKIVELGSLGEGAGGAVTRCKLKDGKTVFALKVGCSVSSRYSVIEIWLILFPTNRSSLQTLIPTSRSKLFANSTSIRTVHRIIFAATMVPSWTSPRAPFRLPWSSVKVAVSTVSTRRSRSSEDELERRSLARLQRACSTD
jgi:hypothetical protein